MLLVHLLVIINWCSRYVLQREHLDIGGLSSSDPLRKEVLHIKFEIFVLILLTVAHVTYIFKCCVVFVQLKSEQSFSFNNFGGLRERALECEAQFRINFDVLVGRRV